MNEQALSSMTEHVAQLQASVRTLNKALVEAERALRIFNSKLGVDNEWTTKN